MAAHLFTDGCKFAEPGRDLLPEGSRVAIGRQAGQRHLAVLQSLHDLPRLCRLHARHRVFMSHYDSYKLYWLSYISLFIV